MNSWEASALEYQYGDQTAVVDRRHAAPPQQSDNIIFHPTLYTSSGVDVMSILLQIYNRPNPQVYLGAIDASCPMILVDLKQLDCPIIYVSEAFTLLTGYSKQEVLGRNCRFLQAPPGKAPKLNAMQREVVRSMRHAVKENRECQVTVTNYRKDGTKFLNFLTMIPVKWNSRDFNYSVGLQIEVDE